MCHWGMLLVVRSIITLISEPEISAHIKYIQLVSRLHCQAIVNS